MPARGHTLEIKMNKTGYRPSSESSGRNGHKHRRNTTQKHKENSLTLARQNKPLIHLLSGIMLFSSEASYLRTDPVLVKPEHARDMSRYLFTFSFLKVYLINQPGGSKKNKLWYYPNSSAE